jgi:hypothetical protein
MIFNKDRMAKLSGLMTESKKGIDDPMADQFGGGKDEGDPWLDGEVTTEGAEEEESMEEADADEEAAVREMIRTELRKAKASVTAEKEEEAAVREAVRREIRSVLRSRGVTLGGAGWGFKR